MPKGSFIPFTTAQKAFILKEYLNTPTKHIAKKLKCGAPRIHGFLKANGKLVPQELKQKWMHEMRFKKGHVSNNKGKKMLDLYGPEVMKKMQKSQFKKGIIPHNTKYNGHERITVDGYIEIRIASRKYKLKHRVQWEKEIGPIPKGQILICKTEEKTNTQPSNWKLTCRVELMFTNSCQNHEKEIIPALVLKSKLDKIIREKNG